MITASERLVRIPATICGSAAGSTIRRIRSSGPRPYERAVSRRVGSMPRTPSIVFSSTGKQAEEGDERDLLRVPDRVQQHDRDRQQRRRRHRPPVLDVRHRPDARPPRESERDAERDPGDHGDHEPEADPLEARDDVGAELREQPHVLELDEDRREARELRVARGRPQLPARRGSRPEPRSRAPIFSAVYVVCSRRPRPLRRVPAQRAPLERRR